MRGIQQLKQLLNISIWLEAPHYVPVILSIWVFLLISAVSTRSASESPPILDGEVLSHFAMGVYLMESGDTHSAVDYFEAAWEKSDYHPFIGAKLAEAYYYLKRFPSSESVADEVLSRDPDNYIALLLKAKIKYLQRDPRSSLRYLERIVETHRSSFEIQRMLGNIYYEIGEDEKALEAFENALKLDPNSASMQYRYGLLLTSAGRHAEAEEAFRKSIAIDPRLTEPAIKLAGLLIDSARVDEAVSVLSKALEQGAQTERVMMMLATLYLDIGRLDDGIRLLEAQQQKGTLPREAQILLGRFYFEAKEYDEAEIIFAELHEKDPDSPELARILGDICLRKGEPEKALKYFRMAIDASPDDYRRYLGLFFASSSRFAPEDGTRIELSDKETAELLHKAGSLVTEEDFDGNYLVGICYMSVDSLDAGRKYLLHALALMPDDEGTLLNLANIAEKSGRFEEAEGYLIRLLERKPDDPTICNFYGYLLAEMGKNLERAEELIRKALEKDPSNGYYIDSLGWVFYQRGEYDLAVVELEKASIIVPDDPVILEHLGDAYRALKRFRDALAAYERSEAAGGGTPDILEKIESARKRIE
ncbi:MAG: tetratricopeptide repeat protein [Candidatus Latescibacteria bacterium]|nr:tetratricopeptide repeat protein [Candidatus Latescibacterota bacterium]NIM65106.1 tetratricopeptide repeat protein [Candidatus Latescibacterota bacterium]NIO01621.1 tetratricopeptide repeat protein [Candidatus Latescibacterota bacterium]NIO28138.1 tetratricopeptide repeat protein [Candidatus Latescibacterota bacterium]NIO55685.1 tetratricopeptide repeat protein [Candidatus Latescibacterota bacterium]